MLLVRRLLVRTFAALALAIVLLSLGLNDWNGTIDVRESEAASRSIQIAAHQAPDRPTLQQNGYLGDASSAAAAPARAAIVADPVQSPPASGGTANEDTAVEETDPRLRIYRARVELLVADVGDSTARFLALVESHGGYLESRTDGAVICRVPALKFRDALTATKALGQVLKFAESIEDVTTQRRELGIRIENAQKSRARLIELLDRATEVAAILDIERELRRLTEEIEMLEASARGIDSRVAFSTLEAMFWPNAPESTQPATRPPLFPWLDRIGIEPLLSTMERADPRKGGFFASVFSRKLDSPKSFVITEGSSRADVRALAADRSAFRSRTYETAPDGDAAFWLATFKSDFVERRGYVVLAERQVEVAGHDGVEFTIERTVRGRALRYLVAIAVDEGRHSDEIQVVEYLAEVVAFEPHLEAVRMSAKIAATE